MEQERKRAVHRALLGWHRRQGMRVPWRESRDPYAALVAAVMAQQTQMSRVLASYERFMGAFPTVEALAGAPLADVIRVWKGMGYNARAVRLHRAAKDVVEHGWPREAEELARIDGVGPFTAAIVASFAFGRPAACVDTNVRRVLGRISGDEGVSGRGLQRLADEWLHRRQPARWNQALMDYGAAVCTARPKCGECVVATWCASYGRINGPELRLVADGRVAYSTARRREPPFEQTTRYYRGRIVDALRALPAGATMTATELSRALRNGNGQDPPNAAAVRQLLVALSRDGLVMLKGGRASLPE